MSQNEKKPCFSVAEQLLWTSAAKKICLWAKKSLPMP